MKTCDTVSRIDVPDPENAAGPSSPSDFPSGSRAAACDEVRLEAWLNQCPVGLTPGQVRAITAIVNLNR